MKTSLKFRTPIVIGTNGKQKLDVNGQTVALSDIPAVRYAFGDESGELGYEHCGWLQIGEDGNLHLKDDAVEAVKKNREDLDKSLHIVELDVVDTDMTVLVNGIRQVCGKVAVFAYINYDHNQERFMAQLKRAIEAFQVIDRLMIRDKEGLITLAADANTLLAGIKKNAGAPKSNKVGLCDNPVSCSLGTCCLSAALCRELSALYGDSIDMVVPSQNHEGMSGTCDRACNCIGYVEVEHVKPLESNKATLSNSGKQKQHKNDDGEQSDSSTPKKKPLLGKKVLYKW